MYFSVVAALQRVALVTSGVAVVLCMSACLLRRMLALSGYAVYLCAGLWTIALCLWCGGSIYVGWGLVALLAGVLFGGVGVVPVALICFLFSGRWPQAVEILLQYALIVACDVVAPWLLEQNLLQKRGRSADDGDAKGWLARPTLVIDNLVPIRAASSAPDTVSEWEKPRSYFN